LLIAEQRAVGFIPAWSLASLHIGFVNFYRHFIQDFSTIARPLFDLTHSDRTWSWDTREQKAFKRLKMAVTTAPVLASPQDSEPFCIEADSSDFVSGTILFQ